MVGRDRRAPSIPFVHANLSARCLIREMRVLFLFLATLFSLIFSNVMSADKPFSFKDTPGKLPKDVVPTDYSIRIVPNIEKLTFTGKETVKLNVLSPVHQLVMNVLELEIPVGSLDGNPLPKPATKIDSERNHLTQACPPKLPPEN